MKKIFKYTVLFCIIAVFACCSEGEKNIVASYEDGQPFIVTYSKKINGVPTEVYQKNYYQNGNLRAEGKRNGKNRDGKWSFYKENGQLFADADFSGKQEGENWHVYFDKDSVLINPSDKIITVAISSEGTPVSFKIQRSKNEIFYRFFNSFNIMERVHMSGNILQGQSISWFENGNINSVHYYKDGLQDSTYTVYAENGQKIISGQYSRSVKVGKWEFFSSSGQPLGTEIYDENGVKLVSRDNQGLQYFTHK